MKRFALLCILAGCIGTAWAQDTIYVKGNTWCPKEKATGYVIVTREMPLYKVDTYTLEGRLKETTYYIRYTEQPNRRMKEGTSTTFYENGNVEEEIVYTGNSPQSLKVFYPDGKIRREDTFNEEGKMKKSYIYDEKGNRTKNKKPYECMATFPGGDKALAAAISSVMRYPKEAQDKKIEGRVIVSFIIDTEGHMTRPKVVNKPDSILAKAALEAFDKLARKYTWHKKKKKGKEVRVRFTMPFTFRIPHKKSN